MKYAFVTFSCPNEDLKSTFAIAKEYGYEGIEFRCGKQHHHGIELGMSSDKIKKALSLSEKSGIRICCLSISCHYSNAITAKANIEETIQYIRLAHALNVPLIRVFCGLIPEESNKESAYESIVNSLSLLAPIAAQAKVELAVETHDDWSDPIDISRIMNQVNLPGIGVVWDVMHTLRTGGSSMEQSYALLKPWLRHVHIHDGMLAPGTIRFIPIGEGQIDHQAVVQQLIHDDYQGYLSGEWLDWEPWSIHLPREIRQMQIYERALKG